MSMVLITHNLGIVGDIAHDILVMYAGEVMEKDQQGSFKELLTYTQSP